MLKVTELDGTRHLISTQASLVLSDPNVDQKGWGVGAVVRVQGDRPLLVRESFEDIERQLEREAPQNGSGKRLHGVVPPRIPDAIVSGVGLIYLGEKVCQGCDGRGTVRVANSESRCANCRDHGKVLED